MATLTGSKKIKPEYIAVGGLAAAGLGYYLYKKHKEQEANNLETSSTPVADQGLTNQSFIPVTSDEYYNSPATGSSGTSSNPEGLSAIIGILGEQNQQRRQEMAEERTSSKEERQARETASREERATRQQAEKEEGTRREESRRETESANAARAREQQENNNKTLEYMREANENTFTGMLEAVKGLTGGGAPGTTPAATTTTETKSTVTNNEGGKPSATPVGKVLEKTKSLFGGRTITNPNSPNSYIVAANGKHCPNTEYNRGHPNHMRGCS